MEKLNIEIIKPRAELALNKLVNDVFYGKGKEISNVETLWDLIETLDSESFLTLHKNVYFADFLRQVFLSLPISNSKIDLTPNDLEKPFDQKDEVNLDFQVNEEEPENNLIDEVVIIPNLATPLDKVILPERFLKLIKRLRNASLNCATFNMGNSLKDLVDLSISDIKSLNGIGVSYIETLKELKMLVEGQDGFPEMVADDSVDLSEIDTSNYMISMSGIDQRYVKPLAKYTRYFSIDSIADQIEAVLGFERDALLALPSFGRGVVDALIDFRDLIIDEIKAIDRGDLNYLKLESKVIVPWELDNLPIDQVEQILLDDIDNYLAKLPDESVDIAQCRWGFVEEKETLEEIGDRFDVTRERIRQKEAKINTEFILNLRINPNALWTILRVEMTPLLKELVPNLFDCFSSERAFYEFLELICKKERLFEFVYPEIDKNILNSYFAENGAPIHIQDAEEIICSKSNEFSRNARNAITKLQYQSVITIESEYLWPKMLGKSEASACILVNHPRGLPWLDIAKLVNANGYSKTEVYEDRLDHEAFKNKDYIYLSGKGIYKHTRFINSDFVDLDKVFSDISDYTEARSGEVFHLNECYQFSDYLKRFDYYEIRHFVKHFGEDYGLYFSGRSQADSIGFEKGFKNITQKDVIIKAMNSRDKPLTKPEIANLLKSKSLGHAGFYLDGLIEEARVVQVDHQLYTTPEKAYRNIDLQKYTDTMQGVLDSLGKPVHASIFQALLNSKFSVSFSKYFYASIARCCADERNWVRAHGLYSIKDIPFTNLTDALNTYCEVGSSVRDNIEFLQEHIAISKDSAYYAVRNWRNSPSFTKSLSR
ncbi:RNA polymerase subunit sigma-70 [Vibrio chagasii]|nr:RNA polymerase subunit sigma-70 [Vibrio chagasii]